MLNEKNQTQLFHLGFDPKEFSAEYAIVPGDPDRVEKIAKYLKNPKQVAYKREYKTYIGTLDGKEVFVTSTGIGGPSTAIAVEELVMAGVKTFIRVGTCGGISLDVDGGDIVIAMSAVRQDGTTLHYAPIEYPATADFEVVTALNSAAKKENIKAKTGIIQSKDSFYGQHSPESSPVSFELLNKWSAWKNLGVLASEMECSTLFTVASAKGGRAGAILTVIWNQERHNAHLPCKETQDTEIAVKLAIQAIKELINNRAPLS